jgi:hypothetical protein|tara:strand:+ start:213 stop:635 length:423 start_codon:yes stop_codon:yes gene_type:complete
MTSYKRHNKTSKTSPWAGWGKLDPKGAQRTRMYKKCGKKCFLGTKTSGDKQHPNFPICAKKTCKVNKKGIWAAYIRAKQWGKPRKSYKSKGKMVTMRSKTGKTKRVHFKGSRPTQKRSYYTRVARKAKRMLESRGVNVGK